jgi:hypothetical protein
MSAKALIGCSFAPAPAAKQTAGTDQQVPEPTAAELQFREALWHEYRREALEAGFSGAQAAEYASVLSSDTGLVPGLAEPVSAGPGWFYQSRRRVVSRTIASGLLRIRLREKSKTTERTAAGGPARLARGFRWWNAAGKSDKPGTR